MIPAVETLRVAVSLKTGQESAMTGSEKRLRAEQEQEAIDHKKPQRQEGLVNQNVTGPAPPDSPVQQKQGGDADSLAKQNVTGPSR